MAKYYDPIMCMMVDKPGKSKAADASPINEFKDTKALCQKIISKYSGTVLGRKVDGNAIINYAESIIKKMDFYIENANKGWYD